MPDDLCAKVSINVMGIRRDIRYNSVMVFQPVSGVTEPQAINQVRSILEGARGPDEGLQSTLQCPVIHRSSPCRAVARSEVERTAP